MRFSTLSTTKLCRSPFRIPLAEILSEDAELIPDLLAEADSETARDLANNLLLNQGFEELTKKSIAHSFHQDFPCRPVVTGNRREKGSGLVVSKESYDKAVAEYDDLVTKQIPENSKAIGLARELGDLKENSSTNGKAGPSTALARRNKLEMDLQRAKISDFSEIGTDTVGIGSVVTLLDENEQGEHLYDSGCLGQQSGQASHLLPNSPWQSSNRQNSWRRNRASYRRVDSLLKIISIERYVDLVAN